MIGQVIQSVALHIEHIGGSIHTKSPETKRLDGELCVGYDSSNVVIILVYSMFAMNLCTSLATLLKRLFHFLFHFCFS